jgi:putative MATE family efflux protein
MSSSREILHGGISRQFVRLSVPAIISLLSLGLYQFVDGIFVGQWVGPTALGAVGIVYPFSLINNGIFSLIGVGAASLLSRAIGRKESRTIDSIFGNMLLATLLLSGALMVFGLTASGTIVSFLGASGEMHSLAVEYLEILVLGSFFFNFASSANIIIRAEGRMRQAMAIMLSGMILNIILDALFLGPLRWGIRGAAWATVISQGVMCLVSFLYFAKGSGEVTIRRGRITFTGHIGEMLKVGFSGMALPVMTIVQIVIVLKSVAAYGTASDLIIIGTVIKILNFIFVPIWAICQGFQPMAGMNYGAGNYRRLRRAFGLFALYSSLIALFIWSLLLLFPGTVLGWFITDPEVVESGIRVVRLYLCDFPVYGYMLLVITFFQAIGKSGPAAFLVVSRMSLFFIPAILLLSRLIGLDGVWLATPASDVFVVIIGTLLFFRELGIQKKLMGKEVVSKVRG